MVYTTVYVSQFCRLRGSFERKEIETIQWVPENRNLRNAIIIKTLSILPSLNTTIITRKLQNRFSTIENKLSLLFESKFCHNISATILFLYLSFSVFFHCYFSFFPLFLTFSFLLMGISSFFIYSLCWFTIRLTYISRNNESYHKRIP